MKNKLILMTAVLSIAVFGGYILNDTVNRDIDPKVISGVNQLSQISGISNRIIAEDVLVESVKNGTRLITMEVSATEQIYYDDSYFGSELFKKSQKISFYADGVFTASLESLNADSIIINNDDKTVTVSISPPELTYIVYDPEKNVFGDTEKGLLRFGDIKISLEKYAELQTRAEELLRAKLKGKDFMAEAERRTKESAAALFKTALSPTAFSDYEIIIIFTEAEKDLA